MAVYKNIENISAIEDEEEEEDQPEVWNAHWRGYWDQLTPGYGGYLQNVIESHWNSIKHHAVKEVVHRDITKLVPNSRYNYNYYYYLPHLLKRWI